MFRTPMLFGVPAVCADGKWRPRFPDGVWTPPGALLGGSPQARAQATGALTTGSSAGGLLTFTGPGLGTKATARQFFFQDFSGIAEGASPAAAGFNCYVNRGGERVTQADGVCGGSIRCDPGPPPGANGAFPYTGIFLPDGNQKVRCSLWVKVYGTGPNNSPFFEIFRCGKRVGSDPTACYNSTAAKFYPRMTVYAPGRIGDWSLQAAFRSAAGELGAIPPSSSLFGNVPHPPEPEIDLHGWMYLEGLMQLNDLLSNNGRFELSTDAYQQFNLTQLQMKTDPDEDISFIMPVVELENAFENYDYAMSRYAIDVGPDCEAKIELINASTSAGKTAGPIELEIQSWNDNEAVAKLPAVIPSGYNWALLTTRLGAERVISL